jgi:glycosyltransferase involved in cell wall biosynthesis
LSQELSEKYDVHIVVGNFGQSKELIRSGITLHRGHSTGPVNTASRIKKILDLANAMRRSQADLFICRNPPRLASLSFIITRTLHTPWIYHIANDQNIGTRPEQLTKPIRSLFNHAISNASSIVSQTEYQKNTVSNKYDQDSTVIPNGYPIKKEAGLQSNHSKFIWVGRFDKKQKRPHLFLTLAERNPEFTFDIIGGGDDTSSYVQDIIRKSKDLVNVNYRGFLDHNEVHQEYVNSYALVNTSAYEGFPNTFLEAWRSKTPDASLSVNTNRFINTDPDQPYPDGDLKQLGSIITKLASSSSYRKRLALKCYEAFKKKYTIEIVVRKYINIINNSI